MGSPEMMAGAAPTSQTPQVTPTSVSGGPDPMKIKEALKVAVQQAVNQQGFVDMNKLIQMWPQISQQMGINVPFETVMQMIQQDPSLVEDIIAQMGLAGIIVNGKMISAEELLNQSQSGAGAGTGSPAPQGAPAAIAGGV